MALVVSKQSFVILLPILLAFYLVVADGSGAGHIRQKREWIIAPAKLKENFDYTKQSYIAKIHSDEELKAKVIYSLKGAGADSKPYGLFTVNPETGMVRIHDILDREVIPFYHLLGVARYINGTQAEKDVSLNIVVVDENDCAPVFEAGQTGSVNESSQAGTVVMRVIATDADEENTPHSQIYYSIVENTASERMFYMNHNTGELIVRQNTLDRETKDTYTLTIQGADMNGQGGMSGTGQVVIKLLDINDNVPTLEKERYEGRVEENTINVEVLRIKAIDLDLMHTDNWLAVFTIMSGNEAGYFSITTDSKTNEGVIMIHKALDYEELKELNLAVSVSNKAAYSHNTVVTGKTYPIKINVVNQKEGPHFQPSVKVVTISEDTTTVTINKVITNYAAIDSDTLRIATNVRYAKIQDVDNWLIIDEKTADIKLNKLPDRESIYLINGTYYAKIICITNEVPSKTATGTIAIQVEDFNDHCPTLTSTTQTMCLEDSVVYVTAIDEDAFPNSGPFEFRVISQNNKDKWSVEHINATSAILRDHAELWPGYYKVALEIKDQQGKSCADVQVLNVVVCTCHQSTKACLDRQTKTVTFGAPGVLLLLLGLLLLLLVPLLLLFCLCGGTAALGDFKTIPYEAKEQLISYHTEGQGEDKEVPLLQVPVEVDRGTLKAVDANTYAERGATWGGAAGGGANGGANGVGGGFTSSFMTETMNRQHSFNQHMGLDYRGGGLMTGDAQFSRYGGGAFEGIALSDKYLEEYYLSKASYAAQQSHESDNAFVYNYEGQESPAGSVGCCSLLENNNDLEFLNDLGPKFKTLAEVCRGSSLETEAPAVRLSVRPDRPAPPTWPSTHTHTLTHTETARDRDHVNNTSTLNASSVTKQSSAVTQESAQGTGVVSNARVHDNLLMPSPTLLIQQPTMYYAATPMYVVDPQPQQVVLLAGGGQQAGGHVGLGQGFGQGLVQVGGLRGSQGMVLVERKVGAGDTGTGQAVGGGGGSFSQVVESRAPGANVQTAAGFSQANVSRSRHVLVVEDGSGSSGVGTGAGTGRAGGVAQAVGQTGRESVEQGLEASGHGIKVKGQSFSFSSGSAGSHEDCSLTTAPVVRGSQRVVVQRKKVSVTERNIETSSRA